MKKARLIKKDTPAASVKPKPPMSEPKPAIRPVRPAQKPQVNPRAEFDALFTKKQ